MSTSLRALIVANSVTLEERILQQLQSSDYSCIFKRIDSSTALKLALDQQEWQIILCSQMLDDPSPIQVIQHVKDTGKDIPVIVISNTMQLDDIAQAMSIGASDYINIDHLVQLLPCIMRELRESTLRSERKKNEKKIIEQAALLDCVKDAIYVVDSNDRIFYWNRTAEKLYGWTAEEAVGKELGALLNPEGSVTYAEAQKQVLEFGEWSGEIVQISKSKTFLTIQSHWILMPDPEQKTHRLLVTNIDLTHQKQMEARFLRSQRMESLGTLASGIAHDLNNVLSPIMMAVQFLKDVVTDEASKTMLDTLEISTQRGASIIKQVLTFARGVEGDQIILQPKYLIKEISRIVQETFPKNIVVKLNYPSNLWAIKGDATQLNQALLNLAINARDAMADGGQLSLIADNVQLDDGYAVMNPSAKKGPYVVLTVEDTGHGIPRDMLDKIFDPFFTTKSVGKGAGLGLSAAIGIIKSHGGFIHVQSDLGKGSQFRIYIPAIVLEDGVAATNNVESVPQGTGQLVLVVEDEEALLNISQKILEKNGYRVLLAKDGTEAIAQFVQNQEAIKAVITDMVMPYMDGVSTIRALRKMKPDILIIAASGNMAHQEEAEAKGATVDAFLTKPFTAIQLLRTMDEVFHKQ